MKLEIFILNVPNVSKKDWEIETDLNEKIKMVKGTVFFNFIYLSFKAKQVSDYYKIKIYGWK